MYKKLSKLIKDSSKKIQLTDKNKMMKGTLLGIGLLIVVFLGIQTGQKMRVAIRQSQINEVATDAFRLTQKLTVIPYGELEEMIASKSALSVLFISPRTDHYEQIFQIIHEKESEMNRTIYVYPLIYQVKEMEQTYHLATNQATFVFFQKGQQKKQFTYESLKKPMNELIPEINRLPMWNLTDKISN